MGGECKAGRIRTKTIYRSCVTFGPLWESERRENTVRLGEGGSPQRFAPGAGKRGQRSQGSQGQEQQGTGVKDRSSREQESRTGAPGSREPAAGANRGKRTVIVSAMYSGVAIYCPLVLHYPSAGLSIRVPLPFSGINARCAIYCRCRNTTRTRGKTVFDNTA